MHHTQITTFPATAVCSKGNTYKESFSEKYLGALPTELISDLASVYSSSTGLSRSAINKTDRAILRLLKHIKAQEDHFEIRNIHGLTTNFLSSYIQFLKNELNDWYTDFSTLRSRLSTHIKADCIFPHENKPNRTTDIEPHTPYAFEQIVIACKKEIEFLRTKKGKWENFARKGKVFTQENIEDFTKPKRTSVSDEQLDILENAWFSNEYWPDITEFTERYGFDSNGGTVRRLAKLLKTGTIDGDKAIDGWEPAKVESLKKDLSLPPRPTISELHKKCGLSIRYLSSLKFDWRKTRKRPRPITGFEITLEDIVATVNHYLPNWPVVGRVADEVRPYRVYKEKNGVLLGTYTNEADAYKKASDVDGYFRFIDRNNYKNLNDTNPGEAILLLAGKNTNDYRFAKAIKKLFTGKKLADYLVENFFVTSYDMAVIYIYWCCLTGWNREAIYSVNLLRLNRTLFKKDIRDTIGSDHVTFSSPYNNVSTEGATKILYGFKCKGQNPEEPKEFTYKSDLKEEYDLYMVLKDYYEISKPLRNSLKGKDANCFLIGMANNRLATVGRIVAGKSGEKRLEQIPNFFKKNEIYEDKEHTIRAKTTGSDKIRKSHLTYLLDKGVSITTIKTIARHSCLDTTTTNYLSNSYTRAQTVVKGRKLLNEISEKIFTGKLERYDSIKKEKANNIIQVFTHVDLDISVCMNRLDPSWPGNNEYFERNKNGLTKEPCDFFHMCLMCKQCVITETTLPYLIRWEADILNWKKEAGIADFPSYLLKRYAAIKEVIELCENSGDYWLTKLHEAEELAYSVDFHAPHYGRGI